ncbi:MAG: hypothetical protein ACK5HU_05345 [Flavobacteriales bacterium]
MKENSTSNNDTYNQNDEIDLRELFFLIKKGIISTSKWLLLLLIFLFKFLKKNFLYLSLGALLGLGLGVANFYTFSSQKVYKMVVSPNSISRIFLYDKINYHEENKKEGDYSIAITPVKDYKESTEILFNKLKVDQNTLGKINIENYISSIKDFEYNKHIISIYSDKSLDTEKIQNQIVAAVENSSLIMKRQKEELKILNAEKKRIEANLHNIDKTIQKDLESEDNKAPSGSILVNNPSKSDVFSAYQNLSNKLSSIEREIDRQRETLQVLSDLSFIGETRFQDDLSHLRPKKSNILLGFGKFILLGLGMVLFLIIGLNIFRYFLKKSV